jgi:hypothetical protein
MSKTFQDQHEITHHLPRPILPVQAQDHAKVQLNYISRIGLLDVSHPSRSHGRTELITKFINLLSNCSTFVHPNVIRKTEISAYLLKKFNKHNNSNNLKKNNNVNNHNDLNNYNNTCSPCDSVQKPQFQKMSSIMCTIPLFKTCIFLTNRPFCRQPEYMQYKAELNLPQNAIQEKNSLHVDFGIH